MIANTHKNLQLINYKLKAALFKKILMELISEYDMIMANQKTV